MAKLMGIGPPSMRSFTMIPGAQAYMPPETLEDNPDYSEKVDCFSLGVIMIQVMTKLFPDPSSLFIDAQIEHPQYPRGRVKILVPEAERRRNHIDLVDPNNPLLEVALECLKDDGAEHPTSHNLVEKFLALKESSQYLESARSKKEHGQEMKLKNQYLEEELHELQERNEKLAQDLSTADVQIKELQQELHTLKQQTILSPENIHFRWNREGYALRTLHRSVDAVVGKEKVYFRCARSQEILAYTFKKDPSSRSSWSKLPDAQNKGVSLAIVRNCLVTVGGDHPYSNELFSLVDEDSHPRWTSEFPPMPTKRSKAVVLCSGDLLIVAGGEEDGKKTTTKVEIMNTRTQQWFIAANMPVACFSASGTICENKIYILGGFINSAPDATVITCSVPELLLSASVSESTTKSLNVWSKIRSVPTTLATCITYRGNLLAIGGFSRKNNSNWDSVMVYKPFYNTWKHIVFMIKPRERCFASVLPSGEVLVVGGFGSDNKECYDVEIGTLDYITKDYNY